MIDTRYSRLIEKMRQYNPSFDEAVVRKAYEHAKTAHLGQVRESGEPYISHPLEVAYILSEMEMDVSTIVAALLHDTVEDTTTTVSKITEMFGDEVAMLVDGMTKLSKITFSSKEEQQAENVKKMLLAMAKDIRVILIKLADRLHNMRTLRYKSQGKQLEKAQETMDIYAPLAHRLGIHKIKWELEDLSLWYLDPEGYYDLVDSVAKKRREREAFIETTKHDLIEKIQEIGIENVFVEGRAKHFYSIYHKMKVQQKTVDQIYDLFAFRIIVDSVQECYAILGMVHELYKPMPGRFKDFIAMPKPNMYQSLHTTLMGPGGNIFEVQIRTWEMHRIAEVGIAAHWKYKEGKDESNTKNQDLTWVRQLIETQKESVNAHEFMENLKVDLFTDEVFVFTPKGNVINMAQGATPVDFAYMIHSEVGNKTVGAKVNGKIVTLNYVLNNGDVVEIMTSSNSHGPSKDWVKFVKTSQARNKINAWFKKEQREENVLKGKDQLEKEIKKLGIPLASMLKSDILEKTLQKHNFNSYEDMLAGIGFGGITVNKVFSRMKEEYRKTLPVEEREEFDNLSIVKKVEKKEEDKKPKSKNSENGIVIKGIDNCLVKLSRCCNPVPGDKIVGFITRGKGVSVHRTDCVNVRKSNEDKERFIEAKWERDTLKSPSKYVVDLSIYAHDRGNLIVDISNAISEAKLSMKGIKGRVTTEHVAVISLALEITDVEQLERISHRLEAIEDVFEVKRG
ncbi:MAG: bifunctional (p)ppGpp synthetase/guanosine-3',5'-bis(diphosphate) 3'-pyrophosphohydrolase [Bacillota bacterium]